MAATSLILGHLTQLGTFLREKKKSIWLQNSYALIMEKHMSAHTANLIYLIGTLDSK